MKARFIAAASLALVTLAAAAHAQSGDARDKSYFEVKESDGSSVVFKDDPMSAPGMDPSGATLKMRGKPVRTQLIKPRLQFLSELLKSAETL